MASGCQCGKPAGYWDYRANAEEILTGCSRREIDFADHSQARRVHWSVSDPKWGYGKVDALAALDSVAATLSNPTSVSAAILPSSRSVQVGVPATAFVAMANAPG